MCMLFLSFFTKIGVLEICSLNVKIVLAAFQNYIHKNILPKILEHDNFSFRNKNRQAVWFK